MNCCGRRPRNDLSENKLTSSHSLELIFEILPYYRWQITISHPSYPAHNAHATLTFWYRNNHRSMCVSKWKVAESKVQMFNTHPIPTLPLHSTPLPNLISLQLPGNMYQLLGLRKHNSDWRSSLLPPHWQDKSERK